MAAKAQEDTKLAASEAEAEAIANVTQEVNAQSAAQQVEAQSTPSTKSSKKSSERRFGPRPYRFPRTGLSKENVEYAHGRGWYDTGLGEESSDSDDSTEKRHQEKCLIARAEETERHRQGSAITGRECLLVDAEARAKLLREGELSDLDQSPWDIDIHSRSTATANLPAGKLHSMSAPLSVWLDGSKGTETLSDRRTFRAQDLGQWHDAPTEDYAEEGNELYSKEHGNEAHELHRREDTLIFARRDDEDLKLRELMQAKEWTPSTPTPPSGSRKAYPRPTPSSSHQTALHYRASAGRLSRPRRPGGHPREDA